MRRSKLVKNITTDELAIMMSNSFEAQTKLIVDGFNKSDEKFDKVFKTLKVIDDKLDDVSSIKHRVDAMENALSIPALKKN